MLFNLESEHLGMYSKELTRNVHQDPIFIMSMTEILETT